MTYKEKLKQIDPDAIDDTCCGGCVGCPGSYSELNDDGLPEGECNWDAETCTRCWNREIPGTEVEKEKENMDTNATKEQLIAEIKKAYATIHEMEDRMKNLERYKAYEETANEIKAMHTAFMNSGFSDEQAHDMVKILLAATLPGVMKGLF